jgi:hypothetical protein
VPLTPVTALLSVTDCKIYPLTADPSGGTATYDSAIDLPDMTGVKLAGKTDVKERRGDGTVRDRRAILKDLTLTLDNTILSGTVLAALEGGTLTQSGTTPNMQWKYVYGAAAIAPYVKLAAQCTDTDYPGGDFTLTIYKAKLNNKVELGMSDDDFVKYSYELGAVARSSDNAYYEVVGHETLVLLT